MRFTSSRAVHNLLSKHHARPSKGLGQHFLVHEKTLATIIEAAALTPKDTIIEVGPGIGTLTASLAQHAGRVIAIEKDSTMVEILKETLADKNNVQIIEGNALELEKAFELPKRYKVVANIPYYLTSPLIRTFLESPAQPELIVLMIQKEVAQRICAKPPRMSLLAASVQFYARPRIVSYVKKTYFWPPPKVDSAIITLVPHQEKPKNTDGFFRVVKAGFSQPRKQLSGNLSRHLKKTRKETDQWLLQQGIAPTQRAQTLGLDQWIGLVKTVNL